MPKKLDIMGNSNTNEFCELFKISDFGKYTPIFLGSMYSSSGEPAVSYGLLIKDGLLYSIEGVECSIHDFDGQFEPELMTVELVMYRLKHESLGLSDFKEDIYNSSLKDLLNKISADPEAFGLKSLNDQNKFLSFMTQWQEATEFTPTININLETEKLSNLTHKLHLDDPHGFGPIDMYKIIDRQYSLFIEKNNDTYKYHLFSAWYQLSREEATTEGTKILNDLLYSIHNNINIFTPS